MATYIEFAAEVALVTVTSLAIQTAWRWWRDKPVLLEVAPLHDHGGD